MKALGKYFFLLLAFACTSLQTMAYDDGEDVTRLLVNGDLKHTGGWTATLGSFDINTQKQLMERWWGDWKAEQTVQDVPNGIYRLQVQGFQWCHWEWDKAEAEWNDGNGSPSFKVKTKIRLNEQEMLVKNVFACGPTAIQEGYKAKDYYVPNTTDLAVKFFDLGLYENEVQTIVNSNTLKIEFDCSEAGFWNCFRNIRLTYVCSPESEQYDSLCDAINHVDNSVVPYSPKLRKGYANPLIDHLFMADPTSVEYEGRIYVYGTNDSEQYEKAEKNSYEKIKTLAVISTDDMANWTYHGTIPVGEIAPWIANSWAPSVVSRVEEDGKTHFYLYFSNSGVGTGVLTSTSPLGPWTSPLKKSLVDQQTPGLGDCKVPFDPGAVIDDNGVGWLAFGGARGRVARLGKDMISFDSDFINPRPQHHNEANELDYIGGKYVYTYNLDWQDHSDWTLSDEIPTACCMSYMTSSTPLDSLSWTYGNNYLKNPGDFAGFSYCNNHTHLQKFQGKWYVIYHTMMLQDDTGVSQGGFRNLQISEIEVDEENVHIYPATMDKQGVSQIHPLNPFVTQQAETTAATEGIRFIQGDEPGNMYVTPGKAFIKAAMPEKSIIMVRRVDFGTGSSKIKMRLRGEGSVDVHLGSYESTAVARLTSSGDSWNEVEVACEVSGVRNLFFTLEGSVEFDSWQFTQKQVVVEVQDAMGIAEKMYPGINLGNTLEACNIDWLPNKLDWEAAWQPTKTTQKIIDYFKQLGFKSIRIPVSWYVHTGADYKIDTSWMNRVKQVVDYCIDDSLYVVLNDHWDSGWIENSFGELSQDSINARCEILKTLWTQIANRFKYYDDHLIFAGLNEPDANNAEQVAALIQYEQAFIDAVRATGGNNTRRVLAVQGARTDIDLTDQLYDLSLLNDPTQNALMVEVHYYSPFTFCLMNEDQYWGKVVYYWGEGNHMRTSDRNATGEEEDWVASQLDKMWRKYTSVGIPVIIGEYAAEWREMPPGESQKKHDDSVETWYRTVTRNCIDRGIVPMVWDTNNTRSIIDRANLSINSQCAYDGIFGGLESSEWSVATSVGDISETRRKSDGVRYNLQGMRVDDSYHGFVIQNGKKLYIP